MDPHLATPVTRALPAPRATRSRHPLPPACESVARQVLAQVAALDAVAARQGHGLATAAHWESTRTRATSEQDSPPSYVAQGPAAAVCL